MKGEQSEKFTASFSNYRSRFGFEWEQSCDSQDGGTE